MSEVNVGLLLIVIVISVVIALILAGTKGWEGLKVGLLVVIIGLLVAIMMILIPAADFISQLESLYTLGPTYT